MRASRPSRRVGVWPRGSLKLPHFAPKAKRAIYLFMSGGPPQMDLLDYKPNLAAQFDKDMPDSVRGNQQLTGMTAGQARFPRRAVALALSSSYGQTGTWVSDLLPYTARMVDDLTIIKIDQHRRHQSRAGDHADEYRQHECGQAVPGLVARLRPRQHERQSADLHGAADARLNPQGEQPAGLVALVEQRISFLGVCGRGFALGGRSRALSDAIPTGWIAKCAARCSTR